jgi:DNA polymerase-3 subunit epsilon
MDFAAQASIRAVMREIVFDTETTGLSPTEGHRLVEIGCLELVNRCETGNVFHVYLNPDRPMPAEAAAVHGLTDDFLADKPRFEQVVDDFLDFVGDSQLVAHNAGFDMGFLNAELKRIGKPPIWAERATDTLAIARTKFPGATHSLDALCTRFGIDRSMRQFHGALLDAQLLAQVYVELTGGRQIGFDLAAEAGAEVAAAAGERVYRAPRAHAASEAELARHAAFVAKLKEPVWLIP